MSSYCCSGTTQEDLRIEGHWRVNGTHYARTSEAWLSRMDENKEEIMPILGEIYGEVCMCSVFCVRQQQVGRVDWYLLPGAIFRRNFRRLVGGRVQGGSTVPLPPVLFVVQLLNPGCLFHQNQASLGRRQC